MLEIGVLADDLTGALASAARLQERGLQSTVLWSQRRPPAQAEAVVVDMRTRDSGARAGSIAEGWAAFLSSLGCRRLEQRIDSALQGRPAEEIDGALRGAALTDPLVVAVPAFPAAGRCTVDGKQQVDLSGEQPRRLDVAATLFPGARVAPIGIPVIEQGADAVAALMHRALANSVRRIVADADHERHLETLAAAVAQLEQDAVELVTASPGAWLRFHPTAIPSPRSFVLVVVASPTAQNRAQLEALRDRDGVVLIETLSAVGAAARSPEPAQRAAHEAAAALASRTSRGWRCLGVVVSGGHAASSLADALGAEAIAAVGELRPLCPLGVLRGGAWDGLPVATKGGLVGSRRTLLELVTAIGEEARR